MNRSKINILIFLLYKIINYKNKKINGNKNETGNYLILTAHPDDESMFFAPTILNLKGEVTLLCLSKGNYDNVGHKRIQELESVCKYTKINLIILDFEDNMDWKKEDIIAYLKFFKKIINFNVVFTFDCYGVSKHKNHVSCYHAAYEFCKNNFLKAYFLKSVNVFKKYLWFEKQKNKNYHLEFKDLFRPIRMMSFHKSQLLWYRYLYIAFSNYMVYNEYSEL